MKILEVSQINRYLKDLISKDIILNNLWIKGEISNFKHHSSGHMYFTLKDDSSTIKCVMFQMQAARIRFIPTSGMKIIARGRVSIYERDGQYQFYCEDMQPDGLGALYVAFEQLKEKLQKEGLFLPEAKKPLPVLPERVGVVTSSTGAVIRDIINVSCRRFPNVQIVISPVSVQGTTAAGEVANAIRTFNKLSNVDVIIVARGGGSLEDLWAFNEEVAARAIYESRIPVVSAVGHETDYTIADMVADVRAPTPSAAAEIVFPDKNELSFRVSLMKKRLFTAEMNRITDSRGGLERIVNSVPFRQPLDKIYQLKMTLDIHKKSLCRGVNTKLALEKSRIGSQISKLSTLNPLSILTRGYCVAIENESGKIIKSVKQVCKNQKFDIQFIDGKAACQVLAND